MKITMITGLIAGLLCAAVQGASVENRDGHIIEGRLLYRAADFCIIADKAAGNDSVLVRGFSIKNVTAGEREDGFARAAATGVQLLPDADPHSLPARRVMVLADLQKWYAAYPNLIPNEKIAGRMLEAEALVTAAVRSDSATERKGYVGGLPELKLSNAQLRAILRDGCFPEAKKSPVGSLIAEIPVSGMPKKTMLAAISIPEAYTSDKKWPVIIWLHFTGPGFSNAATAMPEDVRKKYIVISPWAKSAHGWGPSTYGRASVWSALDAISAWYRIDYDRVYMEGMSMGGVGTKRNAVINPDRLAAICPRSGPPLKQNVGDLYRNLHHLPMMALCGARDPLIPAEQFKREASLVDKFSLPAKVQIDDNGSHSEYHDLDEKVYAFFENCTRTVFPDTLSFVSYEDGPALSHYYIEIEPDNTDNTPIEANVLDINVAKREERNHTAEELVKIGSDAKNIIEKIRTWLKPRIVELVVDRGTNTITINRCERVRTLKIYLDSDLIDMDKPVTVVRAGKQVARHQPQYRVDFMLNEARRRNRRDVTYWDVIEVPGK